MYVTQEEMVQRFGEPLLIQLTDMAAVPTGLLDVRALEAAISDASEVIDSYAAGRYRVPLAPVPAPVRRWCADMAVYYLHRDGVPEHIRKAFEDALAALREVASGRVLLQAAGLDAPSAAGGREVKAAGPARIFSSETMRGY